MTDTRPVKGSGFMVGGVFYPAPETTLTFEEIAAIPEVTGGLEAEECANLMEEADNADEQPPVRALAGFVWVAMHRADPKMTPKAFRDLSPDMFEFVGGGEEEKEGDADSPPVAEADEVNPSPPSSETLAKSLEDRLEESPAPTGVPG